MTALQQSADRTIRHDGLTPARQEEFLEALAATGSVSHAAASVGISRAALYKLRNHPDGGAFNQRWTEALRVATAALADEAFDRAMNGSSEPVWYKGEQIGERIRHDNRLLMFLLRSHDRATYANDAPAPRKPTRSAPVLVSTLSTLQEHESAKEDEIEDDLNDPEVFRAAVRELRSPKLIHHTSKRNARRLAAKARGRGP